MTHLCLFISAGAAAAARVRRGIEQCGFRIVGSDGLGSALDSLRQWSFDAVVLDSGGLEASTVNGVRLLRARCAAPIVVLSDHRGEARQLQCLAAGATDSVGPGASPRLVGLKLRQLVQAVAAHQPVQRQEVRLGGLRLDPARGRASYDDQLLDLSAGEFDTLFVLASRAGQLVSRGDLAGSASSLQAAVGRSIDTRIYRIRRHLAMVGATDLELATIHGRGYSLSIAAPAEALAAPPPRAAGRRPAAEFSAPRSWRPGTGP
ncbi:MAG TPA: response regulator transcription factor [Caldimonas sp.]|jgi:DNA-binding response OmpR family regulator|nr:response regulator transcription factor [Caldimonas sp.]HEX2542132.1 response regulator transcription factor [Caldimonas sp.]